MKNLKIIVLVIAAHVVGITALMSVQGCRSTTAKTDSNALAANDAASGSVVPARATPAPATVPDFQPIALNLPNAAPATPAPDRYAPTRPGDPAAAEVLPPKNYTVQKNDTLLGIAKRNGITKEELARANNLTGRNATLQIGQKLIIPAKSSAASSGSGAAMAPTAGGAGTYTVKSGDVLGSIARRHGTTVAALKSANHLTSDALHIGQVLTLPGGAVAAPATTTTPVVNPLLGATPAPATSTKPAAASAGYGRHVVSPGETLNGIANRYKVSQVAIMQANSITNPKSIRPGQELRIPGAAATAAPPQPAIEAPSYQPSPAPVDPAASGPVLDANSADAPVLKVEDAPPVVPAGK